MAERVAIIGTGNVGSALGQRLAEQGHVITYGSRNPQRAELARLVAATGAGASAQTQAEAVRDAEVVILAIPWDAVEVVMAELGALEGRIIIDPTNPRRIDDDGFRDYAFDGSNAERIQALAPQASVVKAFSTLGTGTMLDPSIAGGPVSIPIAGDDRAANALVATMAAEMGLEPVEVGPLRFARVLEGLHFLRYNAGVIKQRFNYYLRPSNE